MTDTIEPGDLIRNARGEVEVFGNILQSGRPDHVTLIAKGPRWQRHDGSSVNPVPGAWCRANLTNGISHERPSEDWLWASVKFYLVTRPAEPTPTRTPQPGDRATVTIKLVDPGKTPGGLAEIELPNGRVEAVFASNIADLDWSPPPPPPWEPEVGKRADWANANEAVTIRAIYKDNTLVEMANGGIYRVAVSALSCPVRPTPPKGGA